MPLSVAERLLPRAIMRCRRIVATWAFSALLLPAATALAEDDPATTDRTAVIGDTLRQLASDPTTYAPGVLRYTAMRLDWASSQPFFRNGYVEDNPRFTRTGLTHDAPISYGAGNRRILTDALLVIPTSLANNAAARFTERVLADRFPSRRKLIRTLSWIERVSVASYLSCRLSAVHFRQWRANVRQADQLGLR
jgi:hypothetical protein